VLILTPNSDKMYIQFRNRFANLPILPLMEIEKAFPKLDKRRLVEWSKKGYIENVKRGFYRFTDLPKQEGLQYFSANKIYSPSYVSLESALSFYQIIPEAVFTITSVSTLNTTTLNSTLGNFTYAHIKENFFRLCFFTDKWINRFNGQFGKGVTRLPLSAFGNKICIRL